MDTEKQSRKVTSADNAKLKRKIKDMESHLREISDENSELRAELATEKQSNSQLTEDTIILVKEIDEKDEKIRQLDNDLKTERAKKRSRKNRESWSNIWLAY